MPAGKPSQSNAMLYTVITFVALFIIASTCGVIYYVKAEDYRTQVVALQEKISSLANTKEQTNLGNIVGPRKGQETYLGLMTGYLDEMVSNVTGQLPKNIKASEKVNDAKIKINETIKSLGEDANGAYGPNGIDLLHQITSLKGSLDNKNSKAEKLQELLGQVQEEFDMGVVNFKEEEAKLIEEANRYQRQRDAIQDNYEELKDLMEQSTDEQIQTYVEKLETERQKLKQKNMELAQLREEFDVTDESLRTALDKLEAIKPSPDKESIAFKADARIIRVELDMGIVYLDIGSDNHVYRGLTFAVYDKNAPIPEDGHGKAEIEVFHVKKTVSAARINLASASDPIVPSDVVANLIWDSETGNNFVIAGEFDFDGDGRIDRDGMAKNEQLIESWGGKIDDEVSVETDFVILGFEPELPLKPTRQQVEMDPVAEERYLTAQRRVDSYNQIIAQAKKLNIAIFNQKRFLHLIGYATLAEKSTPIP